MTFKKEGPLKKKKKRKGEEKKKKETLLLCQEKISFVSDAFPQNNAGLLCSARGSVW